MNSSIAFAPAMRLIRAGRGLKIGDIAGECAGIVALVPLLLCVALWNRFPIIFYDTGAYVLEGLGDHFLVERSPVYSLFLRLGGAGLSLWTIVALQAIATAVVMVECARVVTPRLRLGPFLGLCGGLVVATGLPWYVGQVEPDCFAALAVLSLYLLSFHRDALGPTRSNSVLAIGGFATAAHTSHLALAAGLWLSLAAFRVIRSNLKALSSWPRPTLSRPAFVTVVGTTLILISNFFFTGGLFVSRAAPEFLFARLLQDRVVTRLLDETCPQSGYRLCAYKDVLPPTANAWLWASYSPFFKLGGFDGTRAESARIVADALARYPLLNAKLALEDAGRQFLAIKTGDQIEPQQWALKSTFAGLLPSQLASYLSARQQLGQFNFRIVNDIHVPVGYISLLALVCSFGYFTATTKREAALSAGFVLLALAGNALICGALSNPHDRYQSRLIWMVPFAVALAASGSTTMQSDETAILALQQN